MHTFRNGGVRIVALLTNPELRIDELGPPEFKSNERFAKPQTVRLTLPGERYVYDVRAGKRLGQALRAHVALDPYEPTIYGHRGIAIAEMELSAPSRAATREPHRGGSVCRFAASTPAARM